MEMIRALPPLVLLEDKCDFRNNSSRQYFLKKLDRSRHADIGNGLLFLP
jgi:hypothetical protein